MRYGPALAVIVAALALVAAVPMMASSDSYAEDYVSPDDTLDIGVSGYITNYTPAEGVTLRAYIFVVIEIADSYYYVNLNPTEEGTALVSATVDANNKFTLVVPRITNTNAEYFICFDYYSIETVPWIPGEDDIQEIRPAHSTDITEHYWPATVTRTYKAIKLPHTEPWSDTTAYPSYDETHPADTEYWITAKDPASNGLIGLERSMGTVKGHVVNLIRGENNDLADVLVEFFNNGDRVKSTTTDSGGDFEVNLPTGTYTVKFYKGNYHHEPITIDVTDSTYQMDDVVMELEMDTPFFGYDLVHFMMFIGAGLCITIIIISIAYQWRRIKQNKSGKDWILDDMPEEEE